jgi:uncharacterized membrane protein
MQRMNILLVINILVVILYICKFMPTLLTLALIFILVTLPCLKLMYIKYNITDYSLSLLVDAKSQFYYEYISSIKCCSADIVS